MNLSHKDCAGACEQHTGEVFTVSVAKWEFSSNYPYCQAAREADLANGFRITIVTVDFSAEKFNFETWFDSWFRSGNRNTGLRILSGGPGEANESGEWVTHYRFTKPASPAPQGAKHAETVDAFLTSTHSARLHKQHLSWIKTWWG